VASNAGVAPGPPGIVAGPNIPMSTYKGQAPPKTLRSAWRTVQQRPRKKSAREPPPPPTEPEPRPPVSLWANRKHERRQTDALERGQASTNGLINELKGRIRGPSLGKVGDTLQELLNRAAVPPPVPPPPPSEPETEEGSSELSSELSSGILRERGDAILLRHREPLPPIRQPTPVRVGRTGYLFHDFQNTSIPPAPPPPRNTSPKADIPTRSTSLPVSQPDRATYGRRSQTAVRRAGIPKPPPSTASNTTDSHELHDEPRTRPTITVSTSGPDFLAGVRAGRRLRNPGGDGYWSRQASYI